MSSNRSLLILPGDGIGPEVMREVRRVIEWFGKRRQVSFDIDEDIVGGASIDAHRTPLTDKALDKAMNADAVLFGSVGGPKWDNLGFDMRPEGGLLTLRKELDLFANLRPAICFPALAGRIIAETGTGDGAGYSDRARTDRRRLFRRTARH